MTKTQNQTSQPVYKSNNRFSPKFRIPRDNFGGGRVIPAAKNGYLSECSLIEFIILTFLADSCSEGLQKIGCSVTASNTSRIFKEHHFAFKKDIAPIRALCVAHAHDLTWLATQFIEADNPDDSLHQVLYFVALCSHLPHVEDIKTEINKVNKTWDLTGWDYLGVNTTDIVDIVNYYQSTFSAEIPSLSPVDPAATKGRLAKYPLVQLIIMTFLTDSCSSRLNMIGCSTSSANVYHTFQSHGIYFQKDIKSFRTSCFNYAHDITWLINGYLTFTLLQQLLYFIVLCHQLSSFEEIQAKINSQIDLPLNLATYRYGGMGGDDIFNLVKYYQTNFPSLIPAISKHPYRRAILSVDETNMLLDCLKTATEESQHSEEQTEFEDPVKNTARLARENGLFNHQATTCSDQFQTVNSAKIS